MHQTPATAKKATPLFGSPFSFAALLDANAAAAKIIYAERATIDAERYEDEMDARRELAEANALEAEVGRTRETYAKMQAVYDPNRRRSRRERDAFDRAAANYIEATRRLEDAQSR